MVNARLRYPCKRALLSKIVAIRSARPFVLLLPGARDRDRGVGFCPGTAHVEAAIAGRDVIAVNDSHSLDATGRASAHVVFRQREDDRRGAGDEIEKGRRRLAAVRSGEQLVAEVAAGAAERDLLYLRMRKIDHVRCGLADAETIDLAFELEGEIVTEIG